MAPIVKSTRLVISSFGVEMAREVSEWKPKYEYRYNRRVHYYTKVVQWTHEKEVMARLGKFSKNGIIMAQWAWDLYYEVQIQRLKRHVNKDWVLPVFNYFSPLVVEGEVDKCELEEENCDFDFLQPDFVRKLRDKRRRYRDNKRDMRNLMAFIEKYKAWPIVRKVERNGILLAKIRYIISAMRVARSPTDYNKRYCAMMYKLWEKCLSTDSLEVIPQMDGVSVSDNTLLHASNLVEAPTEETELRWTDLCSADELPSYADLVNKWINFDSFDYGLYNQQMLKKYVLPRNVLFSFSNWKTMPNFAPFAVNLFCRTNMRVRLVGNGNPFQQGQVIMAWYYSGSEDINFDQMRVKRGCCIQMPHVIYDVSQNNSAELEIKYWHYHPFLVTRPMHDRQQLDMGNLIIYPMTPLKIGNNGINLVKLSLYIKFEESQFSGAIPESVVTQMDRVLFSAAEGALREMGNFIQRDNPPAIVSPTYVVPTGAHSYSVGTGIDEPLHMLRLDARGQQPGLIPVTDNIGTFKDQLRVWGLLNVISVSKGDAVGTSFYDCRASPFQRDMSKYEKITSSETNMYDSYSFPPITSVASMFMLYRGSIELKFSFISTNYHIFRFMVAYIPGATRVPSYENARACPHATYEVRDEREFVFTVPYINDRPWWRRPWTGGFIQDADDITALVACYVIDPVMPMQSVSEVISIAVYIRGGPDFECSVPLQNSLSLAWNRQAVVEKALETRALDGYAPYYAGGWHSFINGDYAILRYGAGSDHVAQFPKNVTIKPSKKIHYYYEVENKKDSPSYTNDKGVQYLRYVVFLQDGGYTYGVPFSDEDKVKQVIILLGRSNQEWKVAGVPDLLIKVSELIGAQYSNGNPTLKLKSYTRVGDYYDYEVVDAQIETTIARDIRTTGFGLYHFGERFDDIKVLLRRYQPYAMITVNTEMPKYPGQALCTIPILPSGLDLQLMDKDGVVEFSNRCREGLIPYILSAYRYARGGLRFKIICSSQIQYWVQHRPDRRLKTNSIMPSLNLGALTGDMVFNHGYGSYVQTMNTITEIEIPYYMESSHLLLQRPNVKANNQAALFSSLGDLAIGLVQPTNSLTELKFYILYSVADDFSFNTFVGYPPCYRLDDIPERIVKTTYVDAQMGLWKYVSSNVAKEVHNSINETGANIMGELKKELASVSLPSCGLDKQVIVNLLSQILHSIMHPDIKTISMSIVTILVSMGLCFYDKLKEFTDVLGRIISRILRVHDPTQQSTEVVAQSEGDILENDKDYGALVSLLYSACTMAVDLKRAIFNKETYKWKQSLVKDLGNNLKSSNQLFIFVRNVVDTVKKIIDQCFTSKFADFWIGRSLKNCSEEISAWAHNALELTDKRVVQNNKTKANYVNKIYDSYNMGQVLISKLTVDSEKKINSNIIFKVFDRVDKVRSDLIELGEHPAVRKEPFAIWLCGPPNVGKSYLYQSLGLSMLKSIGYKAEGELMCQVHPLSDYWDMCEHQPIITVDDIFAVETPDMLSKQLQLMFMVKSPVPLIPPMADLSDKKKRYNPEIFFMSSNKEFLNVNNVDLRAIHRRRNILLKCDLNRTNCMVDGCYHCEFYRDGKNKALNCDVSRIQPSCIRDYHHLRFFLHRNPINQSDGYDGPYTFEEMRDLVVEQFVADRARESERFRNKIQELSSEVTIDDSIPTISDVCDVLYEKYAEMVEREPHWKILKHMVLQLKSSTGLLMNNCQSYISGMAFGVAAQTDNWNTIGDYNELLWEDDKYSTYMKYSKGLQETRMFSDALIKDLIELGRIPCSVTSYEDFIEQLIRICYNNSTRKIRTFSGILEKYAHVIECKHCSIPFNRLTFKDGCWEDRASKFILDNTSCGTGCIYNDVRLQRLYSNALLESSSYRFYYIRNLFSKLPSWFNVEDEEMILIPKNWGQVLMEVGKDILLKGVPTALRMIYSFLADWWPLIIGLLIGCLSSYIQSPVSAVAPQAPIQYDNVIVKDGVRVMPTMLKVVEPQMANESHIIRKVQGNIAYVTAMSGVHTMRCRGLFITERKFLMQRHYFEEFRCFRDKHQDISFYFHNIESKWEVGYLIDLFKLQVQYYGSGANKLDSNYVLVHMPAVIPMHKNLIKYMPSRAQIVHHGSKGCVVNEYVYAGMYVKYEAHRTFTIRPNEYISPITMHGAITYPLQKAGMCGSVVLSDNLDSPLIGMHVAGDSRNDIGIAEPLYKELFSDIKTCVEDVVSPQLLPIDIDKIDIDTAIYSLGKVTKDLVQHQSDKTKISRSLLYGLRPVLTAPNPLDANDARLPQPNGGPLVEGCKHHGRPPLLLPADICMEACDDLRVMMESCNLPFPYSVLSLDEAICGLATRDDFGPLDFSTSAGFPLSKLKGPSDIGKRFLFDLTLTNTGYVLNSIHPRLLQQISVEQALRSKAIKVSTMFVDCLKDTCLPIEKNTILGKTRIFSISPVQYSIVFRQYFAHFLIMYQNNRKHLEHAIGIDATSVEWDELYYGLKQFSPYILAGDYSNYGPSLASDAVQMVCDIILMWYEFHGAPIEDQKIRRILLAELINPYHLAKDFVYQVYSGIPSGSPITAPLNSLVGCVYMRIMWKRITRLPISIFRSHVKLVVYGDDVIAAVKENIIKTFNNSTLSEAFRMYNIKYTNASKSGEILPYEDIDSVTFLKRKFVMHPHRHKVLGQLPYESIYNSLNWIRTDHMDLVEASIVGAKSALDNAYAYGPTFFENLRRDILKKFSYLGHRVELPTWRQLDESMGTGAMCVST